MKTQTKSQASKHRVYQENGRWVREVCAFGERVKVGTYKSRGQALRSSVDDSYFVDPSFDAVSSDDLRGYA